jgi:hypothetical protein
LLQGESRLEIPWHRVRRVVAFQRPTLAGDEISLLLDLGDSGVVELNSGWVGWDSLMTGLEVYLPGARGYASWLPELVGSASGHELAVYLR